MTYAQAIRFLYGREHGAIKLGLERIRAAVAARGHPQRSYRTLHVAGTNGKGSTCALIGAILQRAGWRTGLLTSPHLLDFAERMRVDGRLVPHAELAALTGELEEVIRSCELSFFEATTLLAFELFARRSVDVAVIEVGMGGRLDATNVVAPDVTVVTGIDRDHTKSLGPTRTAIAGEKAGILKPGAPLLLGHCSPAVEGVFRRRAAELEVPVHRLRDRARFSAVAPQGAGSRFVCQRAEGTAPLAITLAGEHQVHNAVLAAEAARLWCAGRGMALAEDAVTSGLRTGRWPGRFQVEGGDGTAPGVVFDVAHNPQGAQVLRATWRRWCPQWRRPTLIVGMLGDKAHGAYLRSLRELSDRLCLVPLDSPRAGPLGRVAAAARRAGFAPVCCAGMTDAWEQARRHGRAALITGSFLTVEAGMRLLGMRAARTLYPLGGASPRADRREERSVG